MAPGIFKSTVVDAVHGSSAGGLCVPFTYTKGWKVLAYTLVKLPAFTV